MLGRRYKVGDIDKDVVKHVYVGGRIWRSVQDTHVGLVLCHLDHRVVGRQDTAFLRTAAHHDLVAQQLVPGHQIPHRVLPKFLELFRGHYIVHELLPPHSQPLDEVLYAAQLIVATRKQQLMKPSIVPLA